MKKIMLLLVLVCLVSCGGSSSNGKNDNRVNSSDNPKSNPNGTDCSILNNCAVTYLSRFPLEYTFSLNNSITATYNVNIYNSSGTKVGTSTKIFCGSGRCEGQFLSYLVTEIDDRANTSLIKIQDLSLSSSFPFDYSIRIEK